MGQTEVENTMYEQSSKKGRHRKKQLFNSIVQQMEFYFSDSNLSKDRFLSKLIAENPYVDLDVFLNFNKIRKLTTSITELQRAISKSESELLELSEDKTKIRRKTPFKPKENVDDCTIYVETIKTDASHEWLTSVFSEYGTVVYVSIPKYKQNKAIKGFAFVEFKTEKEAQNALEYFESIGAKMPSDANPADLKSIATFEGDKEVEAAEGDGGNKRKLSEDEQSDEVTKKIKTEDETGNQSETVIVDDQGDGVDKKRKISVDEQDDGVAKKLKTDDKKENQGEPEVEDVHKSKKKTKKEVRKKNYIKELGLQVLSKKDWKRMRNRYLDAQKKKMKEFKLHLLNARFAKPNYNERVKKPNGNEDKPTEEPHAKLEFIPGVVVKIKLPEPCADAKKLKNDIKSLTTEAKYVDVPLPAGSEEVFVRFADNYSAKEFCKQDFPGEKTLLENEDEKAYWDKIQNDRNVKFAKGAKKQRGRDKLLKKAEKEMARHIRFEESETI